MTGVKIGIGLTAQLNETYYLYQEDLKFRLEE